jgi:hypothetical protein
METFKSHQDIQYYIFRELRKRKENHKSESLIKIVQQVFLDETIVFMLSSLLNEKENKQLGGMSPKDIIDFIFEAIDTEIEKQAYEGNTVLIKTFTEDGPEKESNNQKSLTKDETTEETFPQVEDSDKPDNEDDSDGPMVVEFETSSRSNYEVRNRIFLPDISSTEFTITDLDKSETLQAINPLTIEERSPDLALVLIDRYYDELPFFEKEAFKLRILRKSGFYESKPERKLFIKTSEYFIKLGAEYGLLTMLFSEEEIRTLQHCAAIRIRTIWKNLLNNRIMKHTLPILEEYSLSHQQN